MRLYLVRHGEAQSGYDDAQRPVTESGLASLDRLALALAKTGAIDVSEIRHSTKLRARQTAERLAQRLDLAASLKEVDYLGPMDDVAIADAQLANGSESLMLVGHLPHMARLASLLICGDPLQDAFVFHTGTILCLRRYPLTSIRDDARRPRWTIEWMMNPLLIDG